MVERGVEKIGPFSVGLKKNKERPVTNSRPDNFLRLSINANRSNMRASIVMYSNFMKIQVLLCTLCYAVLTGK